MRKDEQNSIVWSNESISSKTETVEHHSIQKSWQSVKKIHTDFSLETTQQIKLMNVMFRDIKICSDGNSFDMPKYIEIRLNMDECKIGTDCSSTVL